MWSFSDDQIDSNHFKSSQIRKNKTKSQWKRSFISVSFVAAFTLFIFKKNTPCFNSEHIFIDRFQLGFDLFLNDLTLQIVVHFSPVYFHKMPMAKRRSSPKFFRFSSVSLFSFNFSLLNRVLLLPEIFIAIANCTFVVDQRTTQHFERSSTFDQPFSSNFFFSNWILKFFHGW